MYKWFVFILFIFFYAVLTWQWIFIFTVIFWIALYVYMVWIV